MVKRVIADKNFEGVGSISISYATGLVSIKVYKNEMRSSPYVQGLGNAT